MNQKTRQLLASGSQRMFMRAFGSWRYSPRMLAMLRQLEAIESTFYQNGLSDMLRPDILFKLADGSPRPQSQIEAMRTLWNRVNAIILPAISFFIPTSEEVLRPTEWILVSGFTGIGKSLTACYLAHWQLDRNPWIQTIWGDQILYAGDLFFYAFPLRNSETGERLLHPKFKMINKLRDFETYRNSLLFLDEVDDLFPARGHGNRYQWVITTAAKDFRRHNCLPIMTNQVPTNLDKLLRGNVRAIIEPVLDFDHNDFHFAVYQNRDSDFSIYIAKTMQGYGPEPQRYPNSTSRHFPVVSARTVALFYTTMKEVKIMFQEALDVNRTKTEAVAVHDWIMREDPGAIRSNTYDRGEFPKKSDFEETLTAWNQIFDKHYVPDELLLISLEYRKMFHVLPDPEKVKEKDSETIPILTCQCGLRFVSKAELIEHEVVVSNAKIRLEQGQVGHTSRKQREDMEKIISLHASLFENSKSEVAQ